MNTHTLYLAARLPGKATAAAEFERVARAARLRNYRHPPRQKVLVQAIRIALYSPHSGAR